MKACRTSRFFGIIHGFRLDRSRRSSNGLKAITIQYRFLFDECLSLDLTYIAHGLGYQATSVRDLNRLGDPDTAIAAYAVAGDWIVVTNNRADYVRLYSRVDLHPGLIILLPSVGPDQQVRLFAGVTEMLEGFDPTNSLIEVDRAGEITITGWPPARRNDAL